MAFLVLLGLLAFASAEDMNSALNTDNECFGDGACAFNALQVHAMQSFDEQLIEVSRDAANSSKADQAAAKEPIPPGSTGALCREPGQELLKYLFALVLQLTQPSTPELCSASLWKGPSMKATPSPPLSSVRVPLGG